MAKKHYRKISTSDYFIGRNRYVQWINTYCNNKVKAKYIVDDPKKVTCKACIRKLAVKRIMDSSNVINVTTTDTFSLEYLLEYT